MSVLTVQVFDNVTIMFNYMVGFGEVCSSASPMEIVKIINRVFILFDKIVDKYNVFKVRGKIEWLSGFHDQISVMFKYTCFVGFLQL